MPSHYSYLFADLRTNAILAELPVKGVSFSHVLNGAGPWQANLPLGDSRINDLDPIGSTQPARSAFYVERDGVLIYGGVVWSRKFNSKNKQLELGGSQLWSYFKGRRISDTKSYVAQDQLTIARDLINYAQAKPGGNIGVVVGSETSGILRDRTYAGYELKNLAEAVEQLSQVEGGFDFAIDVTYSAGVITKTFKLSYPRRGSIVGATGHFFELPGNISEYSWPEDGAGMANTVYGVGGGEGDAMLRSTAARPDLIDVGYPLLESTLPLKDVTVRATLDAHTRAQVTALAGPVTVPTMTVRAHLDPVLGSYTIGDDVRIRILDERFPLTAAGTYSLDTYKRIVGITVKPGDAGNESVGLTLGDAA